MSRCLGGLASNEDVAELDSILRGADASTAAAVADTVRMESMLEETVRAGINLAEPNRALLPRRRAVMAYKSVAAVAAIAAGLVAVFAWKGLPGTDRQLAVDHPASAVVVTPAPSRRLRLADGSTVLLDDARTNIKVEISTATLTEIALIEGKASFDVMPRPERRFLVRAGAVRVMVIGTSFSVERTGESVRVEVARGVVEAIGPSDERRLTVGQSAIFDTSEQDRPLPAVGGPRLAPSSATNLRGTDARKQRITRLRPQSNHREGVVDHLAAKKTVEDSVEVLLQNSVRARIAGRPEEAVVALRAVLENHAHDPRAAYAAFVLGRVLLDELNHPQEAAEAFARVYEIHPSTPLAPDALAREIESWARAGNRSLAQRRARDYLSLFPDGPHADMIRARWREK
jgi:ferric-dicitrate binding protein FerR (iron transport regulator)